jgi:FAD/FMN-containing dehydrogenase
VYEPLRQYGGSVSAEHGIGLEKKPWLEVSRNAIEIGMMSDLKQLLDPQGILNPGKIFDIPTTGQG